MAPRPLTRHRLLWGLLAVGLVVLAGCVSVGLGSVAGPGKLALKAPSPGAAGRPAPAAQPAASAAATDQGLSPTGATVATATVAQLAVFPWPGAAQPGLTFKNPNVDGAPVNLLVAAAQGDWLEVYLPVRPNGSEAWVRREDVTLSADPYRISVSVVARQLSVYDNDELVLQVPVAVGTSSSPTPVGNFFVTEVLQLTDPQDAYGPYALGLSAFSNTYESFDGGPGQVAIHGTNEPWVIGGYASHGCIRLANADITRVAGVVPPGTPVSVGL